MQTYVRQDLKEHYEIWIEGIKIGTHLPYLGTMYKLLCMALYSCLISEL